MVLCAGIGHSTLLLLLEPQKWQLVCGLFVSYWTLIRAQHFFKKICFQCRNCRRCRFDPWWGRSFGGEHATHFGVLAWRIPWTEEPGGTNSRTQSDFAHMYIISPNCMHAVIFSLILSLYSLAQGDVSLKCKHSSKGSQVSGPSLTHKDLFWGKSRHGVGCIRVNKRGQERDYKEEWKLPLYNLISEVTSPHFCQVLFLLFIWLCLFLVVAHEIFSCCMWTLSDRIRGLVPCACHVHVQSL